MDAVQKKTEDRQEAIALLRQTYRDLAWIEKQGYVVSKSLWNELFALCKKVGVEVREIDGITP